MKLRRQIRAMQILIVVLVVATGLLGWQVWRLNMRQGVSEWSVDSMISAALIDVNDHIRKLGVELDRTNTQAEAAAAAATAADRKATAACSAVSNCP